MVDFLFSMDSIVSLLASLGVVTLTTLVVILAGLVVGYLVGTIFAAIIRKILNLKEIKQEVASSEIISLSFWTKLAKGVSVYIKWLFIAVVLNIIVRAAAESSWTNSIIKALRGYTVVFESVLVAIGEFLLFAIAGIIVGSIVCRIIKATLDSVRVDERMAKYGLDDALGHISLGKIIATMFLLYIVIVFIATGIDAVATNVKVSTGFINISDVPLVQVFKDLVVLFPDFVLGALIIIAGAIVGDLLKDRISTMEYTWADDMLGLGIQALVIFFAVVIALPHFQIRENTDILVDSFKLLVAGVSIGIAIAMGLGMQETFSKIGKKIEKRI